MPLGMICFFVANGKDLNLRKAKPVKKKLPKVQVFQGFGRRWVPKAYALGRQADKTRSGCVLSLHQKNPGTANGRIQGT